jgi:hypothetical protein
MTVYKELNTDSLYEEEFIFDPHTESHGHVHASCIVECPNGDLRAVWYENGEKLSSPYYSGNRDKSDDVRIGGARKPRGACAWEKPFVMSDTFGLFSNNPCMTIDAQERLWLVPLWKGEARSHLRALEESNQRKRGIR